MLGNLRESNVYHWLFEMCAIFNINLELYPITILRLKENIYIVV